MPSTSDGSSLKLATEKYTVSGSLVPVSLFSRMFPVVPSNVVSRYVSYKAVPSKYVPSSFVELQAANPKAIIASKIHVKELCIKPVRNNIGHIWTSKYSSP